MMMMMMIWIIVLVRLDFCSAECMVYFHSFMLAEKSQAWVSGFWPEWCISTICHAWDTPFWSGSLGVYAGLNLCGPDVCFSVQRGRRTRRRGKAWRKTTRMKSPTRRKRKDKWCGCFTVVVKSKVSNQNGVSLLYIMLEMWVFTVVKILGFQREWFISTIYHVWDTPFWSGTLEILFFYW